MVELHDVSKLTNVQALDLRDCPVESVPGMDNVIALRKLRMDFMQLQCRNNLQRFSMLQELDIKGCNSPEFMTGVENLSMLESLTIIDWRLADEVLACQNFTRLMALEIKSCEFKDVTDVSVCTALERLHMCGCPWLEGLLDMQKLIRLKWLAFENCDNLRDVLGITHLFHLETLGLPLVKEVPDLSNFSQLQMLDLARCNALEVVTSSGSLPLLQNITLGGCCSLKLMPDFSHFPRLSQLKLEGCGSLLELISFGLLAVLEELELSDCSSLNGVSVLITSFSRLKTLHLYDEELYGVGLDWSTTLVFVIRTEMQRQTSAISCKLYYFGLGVVKDWWCCK